MLNFLGTLFCLLLIIDAVGVHCTPIRPHRPVRGIRPPMDAGAVKSDDRRRRPIVKTGKSITGEELPDGYEDDGEDSSSTTTGYYPAVPITTSSQPDFHGGFAIPQRPIPFGGETTIQFIVNRPYFEQVITYGPAGVQGYGDRIYGPVGVSGDEEKSSSWVLIGSIVLLILIVIVVILIIIFCCRKYREEKQTDEATDAKKKKQKDKEMTGTKDEKLSSVEQEKTAEVKSQQEGKSVIIAPEKSPKDSEQGAPIEDQKGKKKKKQNKDKDELNKPKEVEEKTSTMPETDYVDESAPPAKLSKFGSSEEFIENNSLNRQLITKIFGKGSIKLRKPGSSRLRKPGSIE